jgi:hypothetical protein
MAEMQRQMEEFVRQLNTELAHRVRPVEQAKVNSLIPVVQIRTRRE